MPGPVALARAFEKAVHAALKPRLKGTDWTFARGHCVRTLDDWFVQAWPRVGLGWEHAGIELACKPMAIDPLFWEIFGISTNSKEPLSFRATAAFQCQALPIHREAIDCDEIDPAVVAETVARYCIDRVPDRVRTIATRPFSQSVREHPWHVQRGAYAITLVTALIAEGRRDEARALAAEYADGTFTSCANYTSGDRGFHDFALDWLAASEHAL